ncbi:ureidoglycolate hydrolase [Capronia coronata CBS 617.96]|uniref:Ureidoglycolate hydrolase n=1 Tax=Capronia coronata CBS 617.96 TaxID=1182541 RepID=W9YH46_9EURO|nr:ureidoglycolate hydrolase [Capronia coronata CBS 617.96]EXJ88591.1 ureidoglycolate hydrolase [Capronia coronata CBS 617.96]
MAPPTLTRPSTFHSRPAAPHLEPLTPASFAPFGTAICSPLPSSLNEVPASIPRPLHVPQQPAPVFANQNSALKTSPISQFTDAYPSKPGDAVAKPQMSMFSCFPRNISGVGVEKSTMSGKWTFNVSILERHPYTTQTFSPLGLSAEDKATVFLVIVAPSLSSSSAAAETSSGESVQIPGPPDLTQLKAFVARGNQAVTYGPGTWHAPMVVIGQRRVDFVVSQFANGVPEDDCQEVLLGENAIDVDLDVLGLDLEMAKPRL